MLFSEEGRSMGPTGIDYRPSHLLTAVGHLKPLLGEHNLTANADEASVIVPDFIPDWVMEEAAVLV